MEVDEFRPIPEGEPRLCSACQIVMLPDFEARLPTIECPRCGIREVQVL